jgi:hypothetical protein
VVGFDKFLWTEKVLNLQQVVSLIANSKKREELPHVKSVNFTKILSLMDKKIKISLFLKTKKVQKYIEQLAKNENLTINDYFSSVGVGRGTKTFIDSRVATFLLSEISVEFKYYTINALIVDTESIVFKCKDVPITALSKMYKSITTLTEVVK